MLSGLERFLGQHKHIVATLEAVSTFSAVVVSLSLAFYSQRANRTRLRASADISTVVHSSLEGKPKPRYVTANLTNDGILPASVPMSFFYWRLPFSKEISVVMPWDYIQHDEWVPQKHYPVVIQPRRSETFFLSDISTFREMMGERVIGHTMLARWRNRFVRAYVVTDDGKRFKVRLGSSLQKELRAVPRASRAT